MSDFIVETQGLSRSFISGDKPIEVLQGIDFSIGPGESSSIQGESGSGKSTFLHLLAGLDSPNSGSVFWEGRDLKSLDGAVLQRSLRKLRALYLSSRSV